jgi:hypothetical protein
MSWHYLQELAVESWEGSCLDGAPDALLRLIPTPGASCWPDSETGSCPDSPSGMTCEPSTASPGADRSMSSAADSPAKTSAQPVAGQVSRASAPASGQKWPESWVKWCPDSSLWKTRQCSLLGGLESFSGTWPRWGMMRGGECWAHITPEHPTSGIEFGSWLATPTAKANQLSPSMRKHPGCRAWWPTAVADDTGHRKKKYAQGGTPLSMQIGGQLNPNWVEWLMGWPIGWTDCEPLEMGRFRKWLDLHGKP